MAIARSARAAATSLSATTSHGLSRSESEITAWSWPSGAPTAAATALDAVTAGSTRTGTSTYFSSDATSRRAAAIANTPGSPPDTTATERPDAARSRACAARSASTRLSLGWRFCRGLGGTRARYGP